jgi:hypothetical protein
MPRQILGESRDYHGPEHFYQRRMIGVEAHRFIEQIRLRIMNVRGHFRNFFGFLPARVVRRGPD